MRQVTQRKRLWLAVVAAAVLLFAVGGYFVYDHYALSTAERSLVGRWSQKRDNSPDDGILVEFEMRDDRTVILTNRDAKTGVETYAAMEYDRWRVSEGVLSLRLTQRRVGMWSWLPWRDAPPRPAEAFDKLTVTPDGPDRVRYKVMWSVRHGREESWSPPTGTWTRVGAK